MNKINKLNKLNKLCVLIREAELTAAQQAVQAGHAVAEWLIAFPDVWQNGILIYTKVPSERDLLSYAAMFDSRDCKYTLYSDIDLGENFTALATADEKALVLTKRLPLWCPK